MCSRVWDCIVCRGCFQDEFYFLVLLLFLLASNFTLLIGPGLVLVRFWSACFLISCCQSNPATKPCKCHPELCIDTYASPSKLCSHVQDCTLTPAKIIKVSKHPLPTLWVLKWTILHKIAWFIGSCSRNKSGFFFVGGCKTKKIKTIS